MSEQVTSNATLLFNSENAGTHHQWAIGHWARREQEQAQHLDPETKVSQMKEIQKVAQYTQIMSSKAIRSAENEFQTKEQFRSAEGARERLRKMAKEDGFDFDQVKKSNLEGGSEEDKDMEAARKKIKDLFNK